MARSFIRSRRRIFLLLCATGMSILPAISIKGTFLSELDIFRITLNDDKANGISNIRFGVWSFCIRRPYYRRNETICDVLSPCNLEASFLLCSEQKYGYQVTITSPDDETVSRTLSSGWTRSMVSHVASAIGMCASFLLLVINRPNLMVYLGATVINLVTFFCNIALSEHLKSIVNDLEKADLAKSRVFGTGFALHTASAILLFFEMTWAANASPTPIGPVLPATASIRRLICRRPTTAPVNTSPESHEVSSLEVPPVSITPPRPAVVRPARTPTNGESGQDCVICFERPAQSELPCKHIFCTECILQSLELYHRCPLCNRTYSSSDLTDVSVSNFV